MVMVTVLPDPEDLTPEVIGRWGDDFLLKTMLAVTELQNAGVAAGQGITLIPEGESIPLGASPGIYAHVPEAAVPLTSAEVAEFTTLSNTVTCAIPTATEIGDVVIFIPGFEGADTNITCSNGGWTEIIDYSGSHSRKTGMYVYRVVDSDALIALGSSVSANVTNPTVRVGICFKLTGALVNSAWPTFSSGSNRSAATLQSVTATGFTVQAVNTATVPFSRVVLAAIHDADNVPSTSPGFAEVAHATSSGEGVNPVTLTVLIKDLAATPLPAAVVSHESGLSTSSGGGQFIVPVAV
jgi:hypothetical protein